ncbi:MAG: class I SAM-dependent methyltransferase [Neisseriales bacterium]|nr:MAG: class I SAM-dependent methyltransferase [Neisseriales bacterium]
MNQEHFHDMFAMEETHFWFRARREIIASVLDNQNLLDSKLEVLEIGSGTGGNLVYFRQFFSDICGSEISIDAINYARKKIKDIRLEQGSLPNDIPFGDKQFDLVLLFDVLEHVEHDQEALDAIYKRLKPGGSLIITVPAYQFLYGAYDKFLFHFRRYNYLQLSKLLKKSGFLIKFHSYFNFWLFPLVLVSRLIERVLNRTAKYAIQGKNDSLLNSLFYQIMRSEKSILSKKISLPFGSSLICIAKKNAD